MKHGQAQSFGHSGWHDVIELIRGILISPAIIVPVYSGEPRLRLASKKNGSMIAAPCLVSRNFIKRDALRRQSVEGGAGFCFVGTVAQVDTYRLRLDQRGHQRS